MKYLHLLIMIFKQGSLSQDPFDFEADRRQRIDSKFLGEVKTLPSVSSWKKSLLGSRFGYGVLSNLAYFRHASKMNRMYFISDGHQLVYIRILKSGSTSLLKKFLPIIIPMLKGSEFTDLQVDILAHYYASHKLSTKHNSYKKFALVRDPFRRIVSVYLDLFDGKQKSFSYATYWFGVLKKEMTFGRFIETISKIPASLAGPHVTPQVMILESTAPLKDIQLLKIEEPQAIADFISPLEMEMPHCNKHETYDYRDFYDQRILSLAYELYKEDVNRLGYQNEYKVLKENVQEKRRL